LAKHIIYVKHKGEGKQSKFKRPSNRVTIMHLVPPKDRVNSQLGVKETLIAIGINALKKSNSPLMPAKLHISRRES